MAKKKISFSKNKKPDWKFIVLLLGILLVGLSVFVLNQKVTYQSSAYSGCANLYSRCLKDCKANFNDDGTLNMPWSGSTKGKCIEDCKDEKKLCEQQQPAWQNQDAGGAEYCQGFNLATCQNRCQDNSRCLARCNQINNSCTQN